MNPDGKPTDTAALTANARVREAQIRLRGARFLGAEPGSSIQIDDEEMTVVSLEGDVVTVERAVWTPTERAAAARWLAERRGMIRPRPTLPAPAKLKSARKAERQNRRKGRRR